MSRSHGPWEAMITGLVIAGGFGVYWALNPHSFWPVFPIVFAGVLPFFRALQRLITSRSRRLSPADREALAEKEILRVARDTGGVVTPALAALKSDLTTERADEVLQRLVSKGYASMHVTDEGRVEYHFPEFGSRLAP